MTTPPGGGQLPLFAPSSSPLLCLDPNHRLVKLTELLDWVELEAIAQGIRRKKLKSRAGRRPHLRALVGAVVFMGTKHMTYREAEDHAARESRSKAALAPSRAAATPSTARTYEAHTC